MKYIYPHQMSKSYIKHLIETAETPRDKWRKKCNHDPFKPWEIYDYQHAKRMCRLTKSELVDWAMLAFKWKKTETNYIHKGELQQMWCYKNYVTL